MMIPPSSKFVLMHTINGKNIPSYIKKKDSKTFTSFILIPLKTNLELYEHYYISYEVANALGSV